MNIKDIAAAKGVTSQAVYKKIRTRKIDLSALQDKLTGELTPEGEQTLRRLFNLEQPIEEAPAEAVEAAEEPAQEPDNEYTNSRQPVYEELKTKVKELSAEVERLQTELNHMKQREQELIGEREYLRGALDRAQQIQAMAINKLPEPLRKLSQPTAVEVSQEQSEAANEGQARETARETAPIDTPTAEGTAGNTAGNAVEKPKKRRGFFGLFRGE